MGTQGARQALARHSGGERGKRKAEDGGRERREGGREEETAGC